MISSILGHEALLYAVIASIPGNVFMFTVGAGMFGWGRDDGSCGEGGTASAAARRLPLGRRLCRALSGMVTPTMLASVFALLLVLVGVNDLGLAGQSLSVVGQMSTPCAYIAAACRLVLVPCLCFFLLQTVGFSGLPVMVAALECAMPVATSGTLYCVQSGMDPEAMMQITFLSVVGSIATIPLVCTILG